jgi:hypothetical protein
MRCPKALFFIGLSFLNEEKEQPAKRIHSVSLRDEKKRSFVSLVF